MGNAYVGETIGAGLQQSGAEVTRGWVMHVIVVRRAGAMAQVVPRRRGLGAINEKLQLLKPLLDEVSSSEDRKAELTSRISEIVNAVMNGTDVLVKMTAGGVKSLCCQLPGALHETLMKLRSL
ncbi:Mediator of RNA polymerase II transcription subunit 34 [Carex littledalei]|uniref:Mediator of RNA polymerase II transcription subunit 34 n=1 Tax=Carex littledalei TaxID=544730 RepID=A0A833R7H3_9POAL|nr:Mediator of RNA polymerase II transcription subunit 34 [Carex littledalei]